MSQADVIMRGNLTVARANCDRVLYYSGGWAYGGARLEDDSGTGAGPAAHRSAPLEGCHLGAHRPCHVPKRHIRLWLASPTLVAAPALEQRPALERVHVPLRDVAGSVSWRGR